LSKTEYQIVVIDPRVPGNWHPKRLVEIGVPVGVARRWAKVRREMTSGLRRRVKEAVN
jgi:hypothetical protein